MTPSDVEAVRAFRGRDRCARAFSWLFDSSNPERFADLYLLWEEGEVAAHLGVLRQRILVRRKSIDSVYLMELLVGEKWRKRGFAVELLNHVLRATDLMCLLGMTPPAYRLYKKLGYSEVGAFEPCFRVIDPTALVHEMLHRRGHSGMSVPAPLRAAISWAFRLGQRAFTQAQAVGARAGDVEVVCDRPSVTELDELWDRTHTSHRIVAHRSGAFVRWRFWECPVANYGEHYAYRRGRLTGYAFTKLVRTAAGVQMGVISDVYVARLDVESLGALIEAATVRLELDGAQFIKAAHSDPWARRTASSFGYFLPSRLSRSLSGLGPTMMLAGPAVTAVPDLSEMTNWWLTRGDSEQDLTDNPGVP